MTSVSRQLSQQHLPWKLKQWSVAFTRRMHATLVLLMLFVFSSIFSTAANADNFKVIHADTELFDKVYKLSANFVYTFHDRILEAIDSGVPLVLVVEIELLEPRSYIWDKTVASLEQRYQLQYHAVAEQYIVTNLNSGAQQTFPSLYSATASIQNITGLPIIDAQLLLESITYTGRLRASIELSALPGPLRLKAIFSKKWRLSSGWYEWALMKAVNE